MREVVELSLQAVAALLQDDTSAIVTLESSEFDRPAKLDGSVYASYGARCACQYQIPALADLPLSSLT